MAGQGSGGNVLAALCSFFVPGLGQLLQGRLLMAVFFFAAAFVLWFVLLGWAIHLWAVIDAARYDPDFERRQARQYQERIRREKAGT